MPETWRDVPDWEGYYAVSDIGRVRSLLRTITRSDGKNRTFQGRMLSLGLSMGYPGVHLRRGPKVRTCRAHQLVLEAFVGPCPDGYVCCHHNGDPTDNRLANLRWDTETANSLDTMRHGRNVNFNKTHCPAGHPYITENIWMNQGHRFCRTCRAIRYGRKDLVA